MRSSLVVSLKIHGPPFAFQELNTRNSIARRSHTVVVPGERRQWGASRGDGGPCRRAPTFRLDADKSTMEGVYVMNGIGLVLVFLPGCWL